MTREAYLTELLSYLPFLPAGALCYLPMRNQLRYSRIRILLVICLLFLLLIPVVTWLTCRYGINSSLVTIPILLLFFAVYHRSLLVPVSKSVAVFVFTCALMGFLANFANGFDAILHPYAEPDTFSIAGALFQFGISVVATLLLTIPFRRYGSWLVDSFHLNQVWYITVPVSGIFLIYNLILIPHNYQTLYTNHVFRFFWGSLFLLLLLLLLLCVLFYFIVSGLVSTAQTEERNRILEIQERQYAAQQKYMEDTAKVRHDFRQTIRTLSRLAETKDYETLDAYLRQFARSFPLNDVVHFCKNNAVNALLNYYAHAATRSNIELNWKIDLPERLPISDIDLCGIIGKILENATTACQSLPCDERWIQLTLTTRHQAQFCIVTTNSFNGVVKERDGRYLSTHRSGDGIGLISIRSTAEKYGGSVHFSHEKMNFIPM